MSKGKRQCIVLKAQEVRESKGNLHKTAKKDAFPRQNTHFSVLNGSIRSTFTSDQLEITFFNLGPNVLLSCVIGRGEKHTQSVWEQPWCQNYVLLTHFV